MTVFSHLFNNKQTWSQRVLDGDMVWKQLDSILKGQSLSLPKTSRCPDVRLSVKNISNEVIKFFNSSNHAKEEAETIQPSEAIMIMLKGKILKEQMRQAEELVQQFGLVSNSLTKEFAYQLGDNSYIDEAYGPASLEEQSSKFINLEWKVPGFTTVFADKFIDGGCAYGVRPAGDEALIFHWLLKGQ